MLVGCGRIAKKHVEALANHDERAQLVAVCDPVEERARAMSEAAGGVAWFTKQSELYTHTEADVALIGTPSGMHPKHALRAAKAGLHAVVEKPMAITLDAADEMIRGCDDLGKKLYVIKQNRLNKTSQLLHRAIKKGRFGRLHFAQVNVFWTRPQTYYDQARWRGTWELDGGAFMNQASHYVDMLHWLVGEVESVMAFTATLGRQIETEDTGAAVLRFRNGAVGSINVTMLTWPRNFEGSITVLGDKGTVKIGGKALNEVVQWDFAEYDDDDAEIEDASYKLPPGPGALYGHGHTGFFAQVLDDLDGKTVEVTDGRGGRKGLELIIAIYKSARDKQIVSLPLKL